MNLTSNPRSIVIIRTRPFDVALSDAIESFRAQGATIEIADIDDVCEDLDGFICSSAGDFDAIIAAGGDGSIHFLAESVYRQKIDLPIGVIPHGTANDFCSNWNCARNQSAQALHHILSADPVLVDIAEAGKDFFINAVTIGHGVEFSSSATKELKETLGPIAYAITGLTQFQNLEPFELKVRMDGETWDGTAVACLIGNGKRAGGFTFFPDADPHDGLLDLTIIPDTDQILRKTADFLATGDPEDLKAFIFRQCREIEVEFDRKMPLNLDGETTKAGKIHFRVHHQALKFIPPAPFPQID